MTGLPQNPKDVSAVSGDAGPVKAARAWPVAMIAGVAVAVFILARLAMHGWDASVFVCAGDASWCDPAKTPPGLIVKRGASGYDGQFYYRIALAPTHTESVYCGIQLDNPRYRFGRIGYPLVCHILSFGRAELVPWAMVAVNWMWIVFIAWVAARMAIKLGVRPIYGLMPAAWPGLIFSLSRCMTETQAIALAFAGLLLYLSHRRFAAAVIFAAAVLTRETVLVIVASVAIVELVRAIKQKQLIAFFKLIIWAIPVAVWAGWQLSLRQIFGPPPNVGLNVISPVPFAGLAVVFTEGFHVVLTQQGLHGLSEQTARAMMTAFWAGHLCLLAGLLVLAVASIRRSKTDWAIKLACLALIAVGCFLQKTTFVEGPESFERQFIEMALLGSIVITGAPGQSRKIAIVVLVAAWLATVPYALMLP